MTAPTIPTVVLDAARAAPVVLDAEQASVIARQGGCARETVRKYLCGMAVTPRSARAVRDALASLRARGAAFAELAGFVEASPDVPCAQRFARDPAERRPELATALRACGGNFRQAAAQLGLSRERLRQLVKESPALAALMRELRGDVADETAAQLAAVAALPPPGRLADAGLSARQIAALEHAGLLERRRYLGEGIVPYETGILTARGKAAITQ